MCKDLRYARFWLALTWLLMVLSLLLVLSDSEGMRLKPVGNTANWVAITGVLGLVVGVLTAVRLFQLDTAPFLENASSFMATRPISWRVLAGVKVLIVLGALILPICIARLGLLALFRLPLSAGDYAAVALGDLLYISGIFFTALIPALWQRTLGGYVAIAALLGTIYIVGSFVLRSYWIDSPSIEQLGECRSLVLQPVLILAALALIAFGVRSKKAAGMTTLVTALLALGIMAFWPWDFTQYWRDSGPVAPRSEWPDHTMLATEWREWGDGFLNFLNMELAGKGYQYISGLLVAKGVPEPWYLSQGGYSASLTLKNGKVLSQLRRDVPNANNPVSLAPLNSRTGHSFERKGPEMVRLFEYAPSSVSKSRNEASLHGSAKMEFRRPFTLHEFPLKNGASFDYGGKRFTLRNIAMTEEGITLDLMEEEPHDRVRGSSWMTYPHCTLVLVNDLRREAISRSQTAMLTRWYTVATYTRLLRSFRFDPALGAQANFQTYSVDWMKGAKVLLITSERGGEVDVPFQFDVPSLPL